ncbi:DUF3857 domain-containing protein [Aureibacter tunicatorum]|uniref:DUF3857 domain-containing protein n=1 Tax=Aureibacter tunicatorum TaxID=866807 RepID=A0AAE4BSB9_9BACT|nr:transglutaminase domain-containing protein [Aureibacter tunicatorum]MDR6241074.1 hypothetical protein [Aureibacter tunicatorum]
MAASAFSWAQTKSIEFGKITQEEIEMTSYEKDPEAKALILYDKGESSFIENAEGGYDIRFKRHKRIKVFSKTEEGVTEIRIPFYEDGYSKREKVHDVKAVTYNYVEGKLKLTELDIKAVYEEKLNKHWHVKKFVFPDVQDGSVLEYSYVLDTPFKFHLPDWEFQSNIPTLYSEYDVALIPFYEYVFIKKGIDKFSFRDKREGSKYRRIPGVSVSYGASTSEFRDYIHTFVMEDVPAFVDETYISSVEDYIMKVDFQLARFYRPTGGKVEIISTWMDLNKELLKHEKFGKYMNSAKRNAKEIIASLNLGKLNELEKANKIVEYVKNNYVWNGYYGKYASQPVKNFLKTKNGSIADINLFLIAMLNASGINAQPLILSTRKHGKIYTQYPFDHYTNYVVAYVETSESSFLSDGSDRNTMFNQLPLRCVNGKALLVNDEKKSQWIDIHPYGLSKDMYSVMYDIDAENLQMKTVVSVSSRMYDAVSKREKFENDTVKVRKHFKSYFDEIHDVKIWDKLQGASCSMIIKGSNEVESFAGQLVVNPFMNLPFQKNFLTQEERSHPVDFIYSMDKFFESKFKIPENYSITDMPSELDINNELVKLDLKYSITNGYFVAKGNFKFKKPIYYQEEYKELKSYVDTIIEKFNQTVVLKPISQ